MSYNFKDAADYVYRDIRGGSSPESGLVRSRINQALGLALKEQFGKGEFNEWVVATNQDERELLLPPEIETAEIVIDGTKDIKLRPQWYRFVTRTTRLDDLEGTCVPLELDDMGDGFVQECKLDEAKLILAVVEKPMDSSNSEMKDQALHIQGIGADDRPVWDSEGRPGFALTISDKRPKYSAMPHMKVRVKEITAIRKPETRWPVIVYAYDEVSEAEMREGVAPTLIRLARLMPWETTISRRKYSFSGTEDVPETVRVFGRLRFRPLKNDHDILPIQDLDGIRQFVMRLEAEKDGELSKARYHQGEAARSIDKGLKRHLGAAGESNPIQIVNDGTAGFGDLYNL